MGDTNMDTDNPIILKKTLNSPTIMCVQRKAEKKIPTEEDIIAANKLGFNDDIGIVTNHATSMFDVQAGFEKGSPEYKELEYRIMCSQLYQQNSIDRIKGVIAKPMPDYWYSQRANRENAENVSKEKHRLNSRIVAEKKPYFMIYVYPTLNVEMKRWINQCNTDCAKKFDVSKTDDLVLDTEEKRVFMEYRGKGFKVSSNPCTINRLCWIFEKELPNASVAKPTKEFDYRILKFDTDYSERDYSAISIIYKKYLCELDAFRQNARLSGYSRDDLRYGEETFKEKFRGECQKICTNEQELCNIILDLCYSKETSKQFVWDIVGDVIVENLMAKKRKISFPKSGGEEFEFGGEKFDIITIDC